MKQLVLIACMICTVCSNAAQAQQLNVATYNIRYDNRGDSLDPWSTRKDLVTNMIRFYDFDVFGVQEALANQMDDLQQNLQEYGHVGNGRDDGKRAGEYAAIFYKKDRFKLLQHGMFWLSPTDTEHPNKGWDAALPRICTWASFEDKKSGFKFYHFNTHFDHKGIEARKESAKLILAKIKSIAGNAPVIFSGDLNVDQNNESYKVIVTSGNMKDAYATAKIRLGDNQTFNAFRPVLSKGDARIDHIFLTPEFNVQRYGILTNSSLGHYPSDHFPVMITVTVKK